MVSTDARAPAINVSKSLPNARVDRTARSGCRDPTLLHLSKKKMHVYDGFSYYIQRYPHPPPDYLQQYLHPLLHPRNEE
jgi:hypothetical protein